MMKKFLTVLVLGLAVFAVSCGDDDPATITLGTITDIVVSEVKGDASSGYTATLTSTGSTAAEVATEVAKITTEADLKKIVTVDTGTDGIATVVAVADSNDSTKVVITVTLDDEVKDGSGSVTTAATTITVTVTCKGK